VRVSEVRVSEVQRARILSGMVRVIAEEGVGGATVARIVACAGVSRRTFYELFSGSEDCLLAVFQDTIIRASMIAREASSLAVCASPSAWREQLRGGLCALLCFFDAEPFSGSLLVVDALGAGPAVLEHRTRIIDTLTAIVDRGRSEAKRARGGVRAGSGPPPLTAEGVVGAVLSVIHARMLQRDHRPLIALLNPLMAMIVLPYLGQAAAAKELSRPVPKATRARKSSITQPQPCGDPLDGLNMRLTYRTLVVLSAIAADPGASNRKIADHAGIHDQGQISKLLGRLERLGLIHNAGHGQPKGEPNAWTLTTRGTQIQAVIAA
jgi:AcrR family transcriptional regulator